MEAFLKDTAPLVLGSGSPRRREILASAGVPHVVVVGQADETVRAGEAADAYLARVASAKLAAVRAAMSGELAARALAVLVADTSVIVDGAILGKPEDAGEATKMIELLAGRTHEVHTRFLIARLRGDGEHAETVITEVTFRPLSARKARAYADSGEGLDKAGGYAVQGLGAALVAKIAGSYTNVVGLPACEVVRALEAMGLLPS